MLPLTKDIGTIAVIGPNADDVEVLLGNYNGTPSNPVTPLAGIRNKLGDSSEVLYARGCDVAEGIVPYEPIPDEFFSTKVNGIVRKGVSLEFFDNLDFEGDPVRESIHFNIKANYGNEAPHPELTDDQQKYVVETIAKFFR